MIETACTMRVLLFQFGLGFSGRGGIVVKVVMGYPERYKRNLRLKINMVALPYGESVTEQQADCHLEAALLPP